MTHKNGVVDIHTITSSARHKTVVNNCESSSEHQRAVHWCDSGWVYVLNGNSFLATRSNYGISTDAGSVQKAIREKLSSLVCFNSSF